MFLSTGSIGLSVWARLNIDRIYFTRVDEEVIVSIRFYYTRRER